MKKYITVAALLAAGAAFSNAAVETKLLWGLDFTSSSLGLSTGTGTVTGSSDRINTTGGLFGTGSYSTGGTAANILKFTASGTTTDALKKQSGAFTLSFHARCDGDSTGGSKQWPVLASFGEDNGKCAKVDFAGNEEGGQGIGSKGTYGFNTDGYGFGARGSKEVTLDNSWHHFVVTFQGSGNAQGTATLTLYVDGASTATVNWTGSGVNNDNPMTAFSFGGRLENQNNNANMSFSDIAVYKGVLDADQIEYLGSHKANASAIPEPSAFGLLAGLGALALVASRRRRK